MQATVSNFDVYEQIDCKIYSDKLSRDGHDGSDQKLHHTHFQKQAYQTWKNYYEVDPNSDAVQQSYVNGTLGCFCNDQYQQHGFYAALTQFREDGQQQADAADDVDRRPICRKYVLFEKFNQSFYILLSVSILILNTIFYWIIIPLVETVGYHKRTNETRISCFLIIACYFVDMVVLPVLIGTNLMEVSDSRVSRSIFTGKYTDLGGGWYTDIGK